MSATLDPPVNTKPNHEVIVIEDDPMDHEEEEEEEKQNHHRLAQVKKEPIDTAFTFVPPNMDDVYDDFGDMPMDAPVKEIATSPHSTDSLRTPDSAIASSSTYNTPTSRPSVYSTEPMSTSTPSTVSTPTKLPYAQVTLSQEAYEYLVENTNLFRGGNIISFNIIHNAAASGSYLNCIHSYEDNKFTEPMTPPSSKRSSVTTPPSAPKKKKKKNMGVEKITKQRKTTDVQAVGDDKKKKKKKRKIAEFPPVTTTVSYYAPLIQWFNAHLDYPYPTEDEKQQLYEQVQEEIKAAKEKKLPAPEREVTFSRIDQYLAEKRKWGRQQLGIPAREQEKSIGNSLSSKAKSIINKLAESREGESFSIVEIRQIVDDLAEKNIAATVKQVSKYAERVIENCKARMRAGGVFVDDHDEEDE
jgi:hypothetical protein